MRHRITVACAVIVLLASSGVLSPARAGEQQITADLEGAPIPSVEVVNWHCHDLDYPLIHCYRSLARLDQAVLGRGLRPAGASGAAIGPESVTAVAYVHVFVDAFYGGASAYFTANWTNLGAIGWNDKISSFVALDSAVGQFWTSTSYTGSAYGFCCNQSVSYVGDAFNDTFSSVRRTG